MQGNLTELQRYLDSGKYQLRLVRDMTMFELLSVSGDGWAHVIVNPTYNPVRTHIQLTTEEVEQLNRLVAETRKMEAKREHRG